MRINIRKLIHIIIPIVEFFLSVFCIHLLHQMENSRYSIFLLFCYFILFTSFNRIVDRILSKIYIHIYRRIENLDKQENG